MNMLGGMSRTITSFTLFSTSPGESRRWAKARDPELLLDALAFLGLLLLLADELGDLHRRRCLGGQVVEELPVVGRVLLLGETRSQVEKPDQLALAH